MTDLLFRLAGLTPSDEMETRAAVREAILETAAEIERFKAILDKFAAALLFRSNQIGGQAGRLLRHPAIEES